jgi:hypothetical protein
MSQGSLARLLSLFPEQNLRVVGLLHSDFSRTHNGVHCAHFSSSSTDGHYGPAFSTYQQRCGQLY